MAIARVQQVAVAHPIDFEVALVVTGGADRLAVVERQRGQHAGVARILNADAPRPIALGAEGQDIAADVHQRILDAPLPQDAGRAVERVALGVSAQIEADESVAAADGMTIDGQVEYPRLMGDERAHRTFRGQFRPEGVGMEAP